MLSPPSLSPATSQRCELPGARLTPSRHTNALRVAGLLPRCLIRPSRGPTAAVALLLLLPLSTACILPCHAAFPHPHHSKQGLAYLSSMPHLPWLLAAALLGSTLLRPAAACSSFVVDCSDGAVVSARTM